MEKDSTKPLGKVIRIDESEIRGHLDAMVRGTRKYMSMELLKETDRENRYVSA